MRFVVSSLLAAGLLTSQMASAQNCTRPTDKTAFDVAGLKSQLMVTQEKALNAYFSRNFGKRAQSQHDDYITSLANSQSQNGLKAGSGFCEHNVSVFDDVMKLRDGAELADFATGKNLVQPIELVACSAPQRAGQATVRTASATVVTKTR